MGDVGKGFQRQMPALGVKHRPRGGVNLHERNVRARRLQFLEAMGVFLDFPGRRFFAVDGRENTLDDHRALAGHQQDVGQHFLQQHAGPPG